MNQPNPNPFSVGPVACEPPTLGQPVDPIRPESRSLDLDPHQQLYQEALEELKFKTLDDLAQLLAPRNGQLQPVDVRVQGVIAAAERLKEIQQHGGPL